MTGIQPLIERLNPDDAERVQALIDEREEWHRLLTAATARAETAEAEAAKRKDWQLRLAQRETNLMAELEQLHAQHAPGPALHARRRLDGSIVHGDLDWCRYDAARYGGEVVVSDTCGYLSPWRPVDDAPATALSATETASESAQESADTNVSSNATAEPTEAEPTPIRRCGDAAVINDPRAWGGEVLVICDKPRGHNDQHEGGTITRRTWGISCELPNPNGNLGCGLRIGHDGKHKRGEREWGNDADQEADT